MSEHETVRVWLSARVDGEVADDSLARAHLAACEACRAWATSLELLTAAAQVAAASDVVPDVAATARRQLDTARPSVRERSGRLVLVLAGLSGLALAAASVTALPTDVAAAHVGLDLIGFKVAIAVGYLVAAVDPRRYGRGLVAVAATAALVLLLPSASTVAGGAADPLAEAAHLPVLGGLLGLALLVDELRDGPRRRPATPARTGTVGA